MSYNDKGEPTAKYVSNYTKQYKIGLSFWFVL